MLRLSNLALLAWALGAPSSVWVQSKPPADMDDYARGAFYYVHLKVLAQGEAY